MNLILIAEQTLNGLQLGVMLFLLAAGLTLVFGIMNMVNLALGALYMVGAYLTTFFYQQTGSYLLAVALGLAGTLAVQEGLQMHGGMGMTDQFDIGFFMKRARVCQELFGDSNFHADQLARMKSY